MIGACASVLRVRAEYLLGLTCGVFAQEYNEAAADVFGRLNESFPGGGVSSSNSENSTNMDLWNNDVGRKYGKKAKTRKELFKNLIKALKNGDYPNYELRVIGRDEIPVSKKDPLSSYN